LAGFEALVPFVSLAVPLVSLAGLFWCFDFLSLPPLSFLPAPDWDPSVAPVPEPLDVPSEYPPESLDVPSEYPDPLLDDPSEYPPDPLPVEPLDVPSEYPEPLLDDPLDPGSE
jgi:hypothetical protein